MAKKVRGLTEGIIKARQTLEKRRNFLLTLSPVTQSLARRTLLVENQRLRANAVAASKKRHEEKRTNREQAILYRRWELDDIRNERKNRREDWFLGPLAPKRDSGMKLQTYGATTVDRLQGNRVYETERLKRMPFVEGDRVVAVEGRDRGKVGKVKTVDPETECCTVEGLNVVSIITDILVFVT